MTNEELRFSMTLNRIGVRVDSVLDPGHPTVDLKTTDPTA